MIRAPHDGVVQKIVHKEGVSVLSPGWVLTVYLLGLVVANEWCAYRTS